jgi:hypothetical protein
MAWVYGTSSECCSVKRLIVPWDVHAHGVSIAGLPRLVQPEHHTMVERGTAELDLRWGGVLGDLAGYE